MLWFFDWNNRFHSCTTLKSINIFALGFANINMSQLHVCIIISILYNPTEENFSCNSMSLQWIKLTFSSFLTSHSHPHTYNIHLVQHYSGVLHRKNLSYNSMSLQWIKLNFLLFVLLTSHNFPHMCNFYLIQDYNGVLHMN